MDRDTIIALTIALRVYRKLRTMGIYDMPLELKGLKGKAIKAGAMFDRLHRAYDKLIETGDAHAGDVEGLAPQIDAMQEDITFSVQTLGNSLNGSGESAQAPKEPPAVQEPPKPDNAPGGAGANPAVTFPNV